MSDRIESARTLEPARYRSQSSGKSPPVEVAEATVLRAPERAGREKAVAPHPTRSARPGGTSGSAADAASARSLNLALEHLVAAMAFLVLGGLGLVWVHGDLAAGLFAAPRVAAVTHLLTLGLITTSILGALYQFLPVALGVPIRSERLAHAGFILYVGGLPLFLVGMLSNAHTLMLTGAAVFGSALLLFVFNLSRTLKVASDRNLTWWCLAGAAVFLTATIVLGASLAGNLRWGYLAEHRFLALGVHLHVALAGWVMLVAIGVAHRLLPMFLLSHDAPAWPLKLAAALTGLGAGGLLLFHHFLVPAVLWTIVVLLVGGVVSFLYGVVSHLRRRRKPALDPGMRLAAAGIAFLFAGVVLAPWVIYRGASDPRLAVAYGFALVVGGFSLFVAGHHYRIVPFLVWFQRYRHRVGSGSVPLVADLFSARVATAAGTLLIVGAVVILAGILAGIATLTALGALLYCAGAATLAVQMNSLIFRRSHAL